MKFVVESKKNKQLARFELWTIRRKNDSPREYLMVEWIEHFLL